MNKIIIQGLWIGDKLSPFEYASIKSWLNNGFEYHLYIYDCLENIPNGTTIKDANEILPRDTIKLYRECYSIFADVFRYKLLLDKGGIWADCDLYCIRNFNIDKQYCFLTEKTIKEGAFKSNKPLNVLNSFIYVSQPQTEFMREMYNKALKYYSRLELKKQTCNNVGLDAYKWLGGGKLLKKLIDKYKLTDYIVDYKFGFPVPWWCFKNVFNNNNQFNIGRGWNLEVNLDTILEDEEIKFITIHNGWIKNKGINKDEPLKECFFKKLLSRITLESGFTIPNATLE